MESANTSHVPTETTKIFKSKASDGRTLINNNYKVLGRLAEGSFSIIKLIESEKAQKKFAMKQYNKTILQKKRELVRGKDGKVQYKDSLGDILREVETMKKLNHPNVIKLFEIINDPNYSKLYLIIDFCERGSVVDWDEDHMQFKCKTSERYPSEQYIAKMLSDVVKGLDYLHNQLHIVHRDIKPQNILETADGTIKIADFDIAAAIYDGVELDKTKGTLHFMAPELCKKTPGISDSVLGVTADLWSLGVTLYCVTYLKLPFFEKNIIELINAIEAKPHTHLKSREISEELNDLIDRLLDKSPKTRLTLSEIKEHKFLKKYEQNSA